MEEPHRAILETAKEVGAGLIVLGTHGRRGLPRWLMGSVAEHVVRTAPVPVLTVHAGET
jgi:nucleotide-binding universal stress UspA family protein